MVGIPVTDTAQQQVAGGPLRYRLSSRISGIIFWGAVLTGILVVAIFIKQTEDDFRVRLDYRALVLMRAVEETIAEQSAEGSLRAVAARVKKIVAAHDSGGDLAGVEIWMGDDNVLVGSIPEDPLVRTVESSHLIGGGDKKRIILAVYFDSTATNIDNVRKNLIVFLGVVSFAFGLIINRVLQVMLTSPIDRMIDAAASYAKGEKDVRFDDGKQDEFGFLCGFINKALDASESMHRQLEASVHEQRIAKERAEQALHELEKAQDRLVQSEKLASLGQLTAGIAHEIKNPLNFINNFSETSVELLDELRETLLRHLDNVPDTVREEVGSLLDDLSSDLGVIAKHGKRADSIVKNMLMHSRSDGGEPVASDINSLVEEALGLAYHGERATDREFQIRLDTRLAEALDPIPVVPQDITRVMINLFSNAFHATKERRKGINGDAYEPTVLTTTRVADGGIEIRIRDNGIGISEADCKNLFTPFFTTKPTGQGTGLGLSISHDIIVKQHNGRIEMDGREGEFTEFVIWLPATGT